MSSDLKPAGDADDLDLDYTRDLRKRLITSMTEKTMPSDPKEQSILLQALDGIDRAALSKKRIKSDEGISNIQALAAETIAQLFNNPNLKKISQGSNTGIGTIPMLLEMAPPDLVPGELDMIPAIVNYDTFMLRNTSVVDDDEVL